MSGDPVAVIGYPYGLPLKYAAGAQVRRTETEYFIGNLDIFAGSSGSPVISTQTGLVEGILVRGVANDYVYDPALRCHHSLRYPNDGGNGDDVTFINQIFPYLP